MKNIEKHFVRIDTVTSVDRMHLICACQDVMEEVTGVSCCGKVTCEKCHEKVKEWLFSEAKPDAPKITRFEKEILLVIEDKYRYIARDENGTLWCFYGMPSKDGHAWMSISHYDSLTPFNELFDMVQWEDAEPTLIEDLLKMEVISYD